MTGTAPPRGASTLRALGNRRLLRVATVALTTLAVGGSSTLSAAAAATVPGSSVQTRQSVQDRTAGSALAAEPSVREQEALIAATSAQVDALALAAGLALERYQTAVRAQWQAQVLELQQQEQLDASEAALRDSRADLGQWARLSYQSGGAAGELSQLLDALQGSTPVDVNRNLATFRGVAADKTQVLQRAAAARGAVAARAASAEAASAAAILAAGQAATAKQQSQDLVQAQRAKLAELTAMLDRTRRAADEARRAAALRRATALADAAAAAATGATAPRYDAQGVVATDGCQGLDITQYPNGAVPVEALCQLWGAPGQRLRADAAQAFDSLSHAYAADFGAPLCVTDSYRSFEEQVRLFSVKPGLAARPGASNHGWGVAVDTCGGVQRFGSAQYLWMARNAPQFGWFHPQWARQGGSRPEAWHWEFAG